MRIIKGLFSSLKGTSRVEKGDFILEKISSLSAEIDELLADKPLTFSQEFKKFLIISLIQNTV